MKRKFLLIFLTIVSAVCICIGMTACDAVSSILGGNSGQSGSGSEIVADGSDGNVETDGDNGEESNADEGESQTVEGETQTGGEETGGSETQTGGDLHTLVYVAKTDATCISKGNIETGIAQPAERILLTKTAKTKYPPRKL